VQSGIAISADDTTRIVGEAKFLRGFYHMEAKMMWGNIPYVNESVDYAKNNFKISNEIDAWPKIEKDFSDAYDMLKSDGMAAGRANKWAAAAFLAKTYLFEKKWDAAITVLDDIIANGKTPGGTKYKLLDRFHDAFDAVTDNSSESVFALQSSVNDGSGAANANANNVLNYPYLSSLPVGCCGFNQPTFDLANSYRTSGGLPLLDGTYNSDANALSDLAWMASPTPTSVDRDVKPLDPRIDWTVARTGVPYYDWGVYSGAPWVRSLSDGGPYTPKKAIFSKTQIGKYTDGSSWTPGYNAVNFTFMRYAEVLLMRAEAAVEKNEAGWGVTYVDMVRKRAQNPDGWVKFSKDPTKDDYSAYLDPSVKSIPAGNYVISLYGSFADQATARKAVHFERKLELGMEGKRFFDLVRWGETSNSNANSNPVNLQSAIEYNGKYNSISAKTSFSVGKNEYYPIPQDQIDLNQVNGVSVLKQNAGY
ncbi:MAG TPA: RagB/SusD family nutrient uptake outer membrane protein, partial [Cyclobacteriaceae bacterium]